MSKPFFASPYYDENDTILGYGVFCNTEGDWIIDDGLDEPQAIDFASYLNGDLPLDELSQRHGKDFVRTTLTFYGLRRER